MKKILFIQGGGTDGYKVDKKLVASLQNVLGNEYEIDYPEIQFNESEPDYGWTKQIGANITESKKNGLILVGHSFGASMILKFLSENTIQKVIHGVFLIATPFWSGGEDWKQGFILKDNFVEKLPEDVPMFFYHAKDDEEIPFTHCISYQTKIKQSTFRVIENGGHQLNNDLTIVANDIINL